MSVLHRPGFLPMPVQQASALQLLIGNHRVKMPVSAVAKEHSLGLKQTQSHISEGLAVLVLILIPRHKIYFSPLPQRAVSLGAKGLPVYLRNLPQRLSQWLAKHRTDDKSNPPARLLFPVRMLQPIQQLILMTSRVSPKITLGNRLGQCCKSQLRAHQGSLFGGHIAILKLIGQYQVGFGPDDYHRLIASPFFIVTVGRLLVTLNDRRVLIDSRYPLRLSLLLVQ